MTDEPETMTGASGASQAGVAPITAHNICTHNPLLFKELERSGKPYHLIRHDLQPAEQFWAGEAIDVFCRAVGGRVTFGEGIGLRPIQIQNDSGGGEFIFPVPTGDPYEPRRYYLVRVDIDSETCHRLQVQKMAVGPR